MTAYKNADFVVTDSFHGTCFSVIYDKPFASLINSRRGLGRYSVFINMGLGNRLISDPYIFNDSLIASDVDYSKFDEVFVLYGKETKGLPEDLLQKYIENTIRIPMRNTLRSLNLSNSVAIITYEILRQINFDGLQETSEYFE